MSAQSSYKSNNTTRKKRDTIVIVGPTASGKSDVANLLGTIIDGEVIGADSMQVYTGMDIGTGKITKEEMMVPHWGIDLVEPNQSYSVALFQQYARNKISDITQRAKTPILCGGTGFYVSATIDDYDFPKGEQDNNPVREKWLDFYNKNGAHALWEQLKTIDIASSAVIHENNYIRVIRALELADQGISYADQVDKLTKIKQVISARFFGLSVPADILLTRIDKRVDTMIENGLIDEVEHLLQRGYKQSLTANSAIGYKEIVEYLEGKSSLDQSIKQIKINTHRYAKRQRTWFRRNKRIYWIDYKKINPAYAAEFIANKLD